MDERHADALDSIRYHVWSGFYTADEVFDIVEEDVFESDGEGGNWLRSAIGREFGEKRAAERGWPEVTDCDRLDRVFEALQAKGVLTRHRCGYTQQDGLDVIDGLYQGSGGERPGVAGYCFYTLQDMEGAMWGERGLWLAFGSFSGAGDDAVRAADLIRDECERSGFDVAWDGTAESRLLLNGFGWQRRSPISEPSA